MTTCHLCSTPLDAGILVGTTGRHGERFDTFACDRCGLLQTSPLPSDAELAAYYAGPYRATFKRDPVQGHPWGSPEAEALMDDGARQYATDIVATLGLGRDAHVAEIGAGDFRLSRMIAAHVDLVYAVEPGREYAAPDDANVLVFEGDLFEFACRGRELAPHEQYDALVSCHVLEHFREPLVALAAMRLLLRPGGRVWLEVPNAAQPYGCVDTHWLQRPHLYNFTAATLTLTLLRAGFEDVNVAEQGHVLLAYATHGERGEVSYDEAAARLVASWQRPVPTGAEVAAMLDEYRARWRRRSQRDRAADVLQRIRSGEHVDPRDVRDAVELLGQQSRVAAQIATQAIADACAIVELLDGEIAAAEQWSADPYWLGFFAGQAATAARASHAVGNAVNAWKLLETEGTR